MNRIKFNAYLKEFPFLEECNIRWNHQRESINCDEIKISRIGRELLDYTPSYNGATGSLVGIDDGERFDFILKDGQIIKDAVAASGHVTHNEAHTDDEHLTGETVLEAIDREDVAENLEFIVKVCYGYNIRDHYSLSNYSMTVYKAAKDFSLADAIAAANKEALSQVKAEANF